MNEIILNYLTDEEKKTYQQALENIKNNSGVPKTNNNYNLLLKNSYHELIYSFEELGKARYQHHIETKLYKLQKKISIELSNLNKDKKNINFGDPKIIDFINDAKLILNLTQNANTLSNEDRLNIFNDISLKNINTPDLIKIINESPQITLNN